MGLQRLFAARSIAVVGGGAWCASIIGAAQRIGFTGKICPVHPSGKDIAGLTSVRSLGEFDGPLDAAFIGVNRHATIDIVGQLRDMDAGGAICFASGFSEALSEDETAADLQSDLVAAAGTMPILGPNCYGFVNALDQVAVWPDQHGMTPVSSGVAILTQSSNIAINLTMQQRALPIATMVTCGNQAQTSQARIAMDLLEDDRVTAIGVHIEGFGDIAEWHALALMARDRNVPIIALKVGASEQAQLATISHTASLAGSDAGADALLRRLGIGRAHDIPTFLETLKLLHVNGRLGSKTVSSISCSGGEASLIADMVTGSELTFPPLTGPQRDDLGQALGPMVALANPLDYHTYVWRDVDAMTAAWKPMAAPHIGMTVSVVDYPTTDPSDWVCATQAAINVRQQTGRPFAVVSTLPELMPDATARALMAGGVVPMQGLRECLDAMELAATFQMPDETPPWSISDVHQAETLTETEAKFELSSVDLDLPRRVELDVEDLPEGASGLMAPLVLKSTGLAHKSDQGGVALNVTHDELVRVAEAIPGDRFLVEEMIGDGVAELLVGVTRDPAHGFLLTLGAGGVLTEMLQDSVSLVMPASENDLKQALKRLKCHKLLAGFRGRPPASLPAILAAIMAVQAYVQRHRTTLVELELNPLICTPTRAVAVDALLTKGT